MVIGTFAYCGSGQDTLADSICKFFGYKKYCIGDIIRKIADTESKPKTRENLRKIRKEYDAKFGRGYFPNLLAQQIISDKSKNIIITGIRTMQEYSLFKELFDIKIIFVNADLEVRYQRMLKRQSEKDENNIDLLKIQMKKENIMFDYEQLKSVFDIQFDFNIDLENYLLNEYEIINALLSDLRKGRNI